LIKGKKRTSNLCTIGDLEEEKQNDEKEAM
jgi:hypothetical protein